MPSLLTRMLHWSFERFSTTAWIGCCLLDFYNNNSKKNKTKKTINTLSCKYVIIFTGIFKWFSHRLKSRVVKKRVRRNRRQSRLCHCSVGDKNVESHTVAHVDHQQQKAFGLLTGSWGWCSASDCCRWFQTVCSDWLCICETKQQKQQ